LGLGDHLCGLCFDEQCTVLVKNSKTIAMPSDANPLPRHDRVAQYDLRLGDAHAFQQQTGRVTAVHNAGWSFEAGFDDGE